MLPVETIRFKESRPRNPTPRLVLILNVVPAELFDIYTFQYLPQCISGSLWNFEEYASYHVSILSAMNPELMVT